MHSPYSSHSKKGIRPALHSPPPESHAGARNPEHPNISLFVRRTSVLIILIKIPAPIIQHLYREKQKGPDYFRNQGPHKKKAATYSPALHCSTIGATGLNFSVRNGKRWNPGAMTTRKIRRRAGMHAVRVTVTRARETVSKGIETLPQARAGGMKASGY